MGKRPEDSGTGAWAGGSPGLVPGRRHEAVRRVQETQQVVAADYGYLDWATLEAEIGKLHPVATFEDFAELEDHEIQQVIFRLGRDRLAVALKGASDRLEERFRANMSAQAWRALTDAMDELGPLPLSAVEVELDPPWGPGCPV